MSIITLEKALVSSVLVLALAGPAHAMGDMDMTAIAYCEVVQPQVLDASYAAPAPGELWVRGDIVYVSGSVLDVTVTIPACTHLAGVTFQGLTLADHLDPIEGGSTYYEVLSTTVGSTSTEVTVRLHFANLGQGYSPTIDLELASDAGALGDTHTFTLAEVASTSGDVPLTYTDEQLLNQMVTSAYSDFGDNSEWLKVEDDGSSRLFHDIDYDALQMEVHTDGVHVAYEFQADTPNWCDPTIRLDGRFHLESSVTDGVLVVWDEGADASVDTAWYCDWTTLFLGDVVIDWLGTDGAGASFEDQIEASITGAFGEADCGATSCGLFIRGVDHEEGQLVVRFDPPYRTVVLDIPYDTDRLDDAAGTGLAVPAGERVAIMAGGSAEACTDDLATMGSCPTHRVTPAGLFEWHTDAPVPDDWELTASNIWIWHPERADAREHLAGFDRDVGQLRVDDLPVGRLLATTTGSTLLDAAGPCATDVGGTVGSGVPQHLTFAPNDQESPTGADLGSGTYQVSIGLGATNAEDSIIAGISSCPVAATLFQQPAGSGEMFLVQ